MILQTPEKILLILMILTNIPCRIAFRLKEVYEKSNKIKFFSILFILILSIIYGKFFLIFLILITIRICRKKIVIIFILIDFILYYNFYI